METMKLVPIGDDIGVVPSEAQMAKLGVRAGGVLYAVETGDGILLTPADSKVAKQIIVAEEGMRKYRDALSELAKK